MAKKRISLDLDLDNPWDKKLWEYLEGQGVKSKTIRRILYAYLEGQELPKSIIEKNINVEMSNKANDDVKFTELDDKDLDDLY